MRGFDYTIKDELGIHARPAGELVKLAKKFESDIKITGNGREADAKRIFSIMGLAVKQGQNVEVSVNGVDETEAAAELESFFQNNL